LNNLRKLSKPRDDIVLKPTHLTKLACQQRKATYYLRPLYDEYAYTPQTTNQNCHHNVFVAACNRHYCPVPIITPKGKAAYERAFARLKKLSRKSGVAPGTIPIWTEDEVLATRAAAKRKIYADAYASLKIKELDYTDWKVDAFVKFDHGPMCDCDAKAPRLVQHRSSRYTAAIARFLAPVEKALYTIKFNGLPMFAKGMDSRSRAKAIVDMSGYQRVLMGLDHSRFDSHCVTELLQLEQRYYMWLHKNNGELASLLSRQLTNKVYGPGYKWTAPGGRMSGDFNTSLGNNVINALIYLAWYEEMGCLDDGYILLDGDDGVAGLPERITDYKKEILTELGMTTKFDKPVFLPEQVSFCQTRPVAMTVDGKTQWRMAGDYRRAISRMPLTIRRFIGEGWFDYGRSVALCRAILGDGLPVLSVLGDALVRHFPGGTRERIGKDAELHRKIMLEQDWRGIAISDQSRASFAIAYDISPDEQIRLEACIAAHDWSAPTRQLRSGIQSVVDLLPTEP